MHFHDEDIFSGSAAQIIIRKTLYNQKCLQRSRTMVSSLVPVHNKNCDRYFNGRDEVKSGLMMLWVPSSLQCKIHILQV